MNHDETTVSDPNAEYERRERVCTERAIAQWKQSLKRPDLDEEARVRGAVEAYKRQAFAFAISPFSARLEARVGEQAVQGTAISVQTMRLSDGRADYYVSIKVGDRQVHPHVFREEFKAAYHVALYEWLLNGGQKPDLLAFDEGDWPAQATELVGADPAQIKTLEDRIGELEGELEDALALPWPDWASSILKTLKANGYDPVDEAGEVDLAEAFSEYLHGISEEDARFKRVLAEKDAEIARLKALTARHALAVKPLDWKDGEAVFTDEGPSYSEAVGAGYTYVAEAVDKPLAESKLDAEGRYLRNILDCLIDPAPSGDLTSFAYAAIYAHTVRKAALREENRNEQDLADELREAMRFIESVADRTE
ncbi:hypothetical protein OIU34_19330 [Pararhizobium sp. BT-229]|uniref:hypothetical protein n=1 Tax=Pararhizobium sp. BT-229 TaxID=2986923 RepID=UPI0021F739CC|nr:hypothetical protein [Pararhizobium sp. BT-229]MCV9964036.1 hypothetical protein [Pararhizobium sp. BT-229]